MALKLRPGSRWSLSSTQILAIGFFAVIMTGAILLTLPISATSGESIGFVDALFTAASCTCVTGLSTINVGVELTTFGHVVMLLLIQIGGMGFMTCAALIFMAVGRKIGLKDRMTIAEGLNEEGLGGMVKLVRKVAVICLVCEGVGRAAALLPPGAGIRLCQGRVVWRVPFGLGFLQRRVRHFRL